MAEIEPNVLIGQCLNRRIDNINTVKQQVDVWQDRRNNKNSVINWGFETKDARIKLKVFIRQLKADMTLVLVAADFRGSS